MKKTYTLLAVLLTVCTALPAAAQKNITNKVTRVVVSAEKAHKQHQSKAMGKKANPDTPAAPVCAACGEKITEPYKHCTATGCTGLCSPAAAPVTKTGTEEETPSVCPICGHVYTIDEKYHGMEHVCPAQKKAEVCATCGNPITNLSQRCPSDPDVYCMPNTESNAAAHTCYRCGKSFREGQHCSAADYNALCANSPEQERQLEQAEKESQEAAEKARHCPKCGEEYSVDELYHGETHICEESQEVHDSVLTEADPGLLYRAEELLQADRDAHGGNAKHTLEYYYQQVTAK